MPTSVPVQPTITEAGLAAIFNAQSTGVEFALTHIAFGTAQYVPDGTETALQAEKVRVTIAGGGRISPTQIQIYAIAQAVAGSPFFVGEVGFFGDDGATLLAVYSSTATPNLFLSDTVSTSVSYALGLAALPAASVTVTIDPSASAALLLIGQHVAAANPHPQYVEKVNGIAFYDPTLAFDQGAQIIGDDLLVYQSTQANNLGNLPSTSPSWWVPLYNYGDTPVAGLTNASVTLTSTQAARAHITLSGALTAPLNIIFPTWVKDWTVVNDTTGAFAITCKTAAGTGVVIPQNGSPTRIRGDGTNITQLAENVAPATAPQHAVQFGQVAGVVGSARNLRASMSAAGTSLTLTADEVVVETALGGLRYCISAFNQTVSTTATGIGGVVGAALSASGYAAVYAAWNPTTNAQGAFIVNANTLAPNVAASPPAGWIATGLVSVWPLNASTQFAVGYQSDREMYLPPQNSFGTSVAAPTLTSLSIAAVVPMNAKSFGGYLTGTNSNASSGVTLSVAGSSANVGVALLTNTNGPAGSGITAPYSDVPLITPQTTFYTNQVVSGTVSMNIIISRYTF
jgi:hypothetical protein